MKAQGAADDHPARHALVEINNIHDEGLIFEPIHRLLFHVPDHEALLKSIVDFLSAEGSAATVACEKPADYGSHASRHDIDIHFGGEKKFLLVENPKRVLAVATLQAALDAYVLF